MRMTIRHLEDAFPELDGLAAADRSRVLRRVRTDGRVPALVSPSVAMLSLAAYLQLVAPRLIAGAPSIASDGWFWALWVGFAIGAGAIAGLGALLMRDGLVRRALRITPPAPRCGRCSQSLVGVPPLDDNDHAARCPECGVVCDL